MAMIHRGPLVVHMALYMPETYIIIILLLIYFLLGTFLYCHFELDYLTMFFYFKSFVLSLLYNINFS